MQNALSFNPAPDSGGTLDGISFAQQIELMLQSVSTGMYGLERPAGAVANSYYLRGPRVKGGKQYIDWMWFDGESESVVWSYNQTDKKFGNTRTPLTKNTTFYVRENGDDNNDGLTEAKALRTLEGIKNTLNQYDPRGFTSTVNIGAGTFNASLIFVIPLYDHSNLFLIGSGIDSTILEGSTFYYNGSISDVTCAINLRATDGYTVAVKRDPSRWGGEIRFNGNQMTVTQSGIMLLRGAKVYFTGTCAEGVVADFNGAIACAGSTEFIATNTTSFTGSFARASRGGIITLYNCTFTGNAIGQKYNIYQGGQISGHAHNATLESLLGNQPGIHGNGALIAGNGIAKASANILQNGVIRNGNNIASVTVASEGVFEIAFDSLAPNGDYVALPAVGGTESQLRSAEYKDLTPSGFKVLTRRDNVLTSIPFSFACYW